MGQNQSLAALQNQGQSLALKQFAYGDQAFWNTVWDTPTTPDQLWASLNDALLIQMRDTQPANFAALIQKSICKIAEIVAASKGTLASVKPLHAFNNTYTASAHGTQPLVKGAEDPVVVNTVNILLNCIRILTRCMSLLVEEPQSPWFAGWLWGGDFPVSVSGQVVDPILAKGMFGEKTLAETLLLLLLDLLFTEGFCVHPSLATTIQNKQALRHNGVQLDKLWEVGISPNTGFVVAGPPNLPNIHQWLNKSVGWSNYDSNRIEVLRCLMVCLSETMFHAPPTIATPPSTPAPGPNSTPGVVYVNGNKNRFLREFVSESTQCANWTPTLFWSLLNVILNYHPEGQAVMTLPYNYTLWTDHREPLVEVALHFLLIVLDFRHGEVGLVTGLAPPSEEVRKSAVVILNPPTKRLEDIEREIQQQAVEERKEDGTASRQGLATVELEDKKGAEASAVVPPASNVFHAIFTELSNPACLTSIYTNICRLLLNALQAESTYLPQSLKKMYAFQELLILAWKLADENPAFLQHILHPPLPSTSASSTATAIAVAQEQLDILNLVTPLLYFVNESRKDDSQLGMMYTCVFLLLRLSGDREFSVALNRQVYSVPSISHIPLFSLLGMPSIQNATYADVLIVVAHKLIVSSPNHLDALLKVLLTLLCNISPYLTKLSLFASVKLLNIFELFSSQKFVNANSSNHQYASMLLDVFNNIIQYQYLGHANLVYSIIRRAKQFYELGRLELLPGQSEPLTVEEQQRRLQAGQQRIDIGAVNKVASSATTTIELAERQSASPMAQQTQPSALPPANIPEPSTVASASSLPSSTVAVPSFIPTAQWANGWKRLLPLEPIYRLLEFFEPKVEAIVKGKPAVDENAIIAMISSTTLVGVLPVPHPIVVRKYIPNAFTNLWFSTFLYGIIYLRQQTLSQLSWGICANAPLWNGGRVKMFVIALPQLSAAQQAEKTRQAQSLAEARKHLADQKQPARRPSAAASAPSQPSSSSVMQATSEPAGQALPVPLQPTAESQQPAAAPPSSSTAATSEVVAEPHPPAEASPSPPVHETSTEIAGAPRI